MPAPATNGTYAPVAERPLPSNGGLVHGAVQAVPLHNALEFELLATRWQPGGEDRTRVLCSVHRGIGAGRIVLAGMLAVRV
jgi:hypothetical protein